MARRTRAKFIDGELLPELNITTADVWRIFEPRTAERGFKYFQEERVLSCGIFSTGKSAYGKVKGRDDNVYEVNIGIYHTRYGGIEGLCSCPVGCDCKHAAALAFHLADALEKAAQRSDELPPNTKRWLELAKKAFSQSTGADKQPGKDEYLGYVLVTGKGWLGYKATFVQPTLSRKLKKGGLSTPKSFDFYALRDEKEAALDENDRRIAEWFESIRSASPSPMTELPDEPEMCRLLLTKMLATGRAHYMSISNPPLKESASIKGRFAWLRTAGGQQVLSVVAANPDISVLWASCPWYVNLQTGEAGVVELPVPFEIADILISAPPVETAHAAAFSSALIDLSPDLPLPELTDAVEVVCPRPTAVLALRTRKPRRKDIEQYPELQESFDETDEPTPKTEEIRELLLSFDYPGATFYRGASNEHRRMEDGKMIITKRNIAFEDNCVQRLLDLQFRLIGPDPISPRSLIFRYWTNQMTYWLKVTQNSLKELEADGWRIIVESSFGLIESKGKGGQWPAMIISSRIGWFWFELGVVVDGVHFSLLPLLIKLLSSCKKPVTPEQIDRLNRDGKVYLEMDDGRVLALPFEKVEGVLKGLVEIFDPNELEEKEHDGRFELHTAQALKLMKKSKIDWSGSGFLQLSQISQRIEGFSSVEAVEPPSSLLAELRDYQKQGLNWLQFLREFELGGVLADDMGLGKTVQTIAHILKEKEEGRLNRPCLILCPTSVLPNWMSELAKFAPTLNALKLYGPERDQCYPDIDRFDVVLTTYPILFRDATKLTALPWYLVALDEAQAIKNYASKLARTAYKLQAHHRVCLTGTPLENHLGELWSHYNFLIPGALGELKKFNRTFRLPIEKEGSRIMQDNLSDRIRPFLLRRTKTEVAKELPEKTEMIQRIELEGTEREIYETVRLGVLRKVNEAIESKGFSHAQFIVLEALLRLRQVCCDPRLLKIESTQALGPSAKLQHLKGIVKEMVEEGRRILLFSNFSSMLDLIEPHLRELEIPFVQLRGTTTDRVTPIQEFQCERVPLFLLSLKAGGVGLNLTAADTVIHYDPWWNPAAEKQATDRAYRIGQNKNVFVYKLIATDTVEDRMLEMQERKQLLADAVYAGADTGALDFNEDDLRALLEPLN